MGRPLRIRFHEEKTVLHLMSKTAGGYFLLKSDKVKKVFLDILNNLLEAFSFKLLTFAIMNNHFHLLIEVKNINNLTDEEILKKVKKVGIYKKYAFVKDIHTLRKKLSDISEFMKNLKEKFAKWFNKKFNRCGHFWGGRFKCVVIENGMALEVCKKYIEMNPVKAGIVKSPEKYKFSGCGLMGKLMGIKTTKNKSSENEIEIMKTLKNKVIPQLENGLAFGSIDFIKHFHEKFMKKCNLKKLKNYSTFDDKNKLFSLIKPKKQYKT